MWSIYLSSYVGTLKAMLRNPITRETITIWQKFGSQGNKWNLADMSIATNWSLAEVMCREIVYLSSYLQCSFCCFCLWDILVMVLLSRHEFNVCITYQVVIEASRGQSYQSDISIDDISFTPQCYPLVRKYPIICMYKISYPSHIKQENALEIAASSKLPCWSKA